MDILVKGIRLVHPNHKQPESPMTSSAKSHNPWQSQRRSLVEVRDNRDSTNRRSVYLAQKFMSIWVTHTFGRVSPSVARNLANDRLQKKFFLQWYNRYWESRIEWKLEIRASCHNRFRIFAKCFSSWRCYVTIQQRKKAMQQRANMFAEMKLLQRVWRGWCLYSEIHQQKKRLKDHANSIANRNMLRLYWIVWTEGVEQQVVTRQKEKDAFQFWRTSLLFKMWMEWQSEMETSHDIKYELRIAEQNYQTSLLCKIIQSWKKYLQDKHAREEMKTWANSHRNNQLLKYCLSKWSQSWVSEVRLKHLGHQVHSKRTISLKQDVFQKWKFYVSVVKSGRESLKQASIIYKRKLLRMCFLGFQRHHAQQQCKHSQEQTAITYRNRKLLLHSWVVWIHRLDILEEKALSTRTDLAHKYYRCHLLEVTYTAWCFYVDKEKLKEAKRAKAVCFFESSVLPKYFSMWKRYHCQKSIETSLKQSALQYRSNTLLAMGYYVWFCAAKHKQETQLMEVAAEDQYVRGLQRQTIRCWYNCTIRSIHAKQMESKAKAFFVSKAVSKTFMFWQLQLRRIQQNKNWEAHAIVHHKNYNQSYYWILWRKCMASQITLHARELYFSEHYNQKLLNLVMSSWKLYHVAKGNKKRKCVVAQSHYNFILLKQAFNLWKVSAHRAKRLETASHLAMVHFNQRLHQKYMRRWCVKYTEAVCDREPAESMYDQACIVLDRVILKSTFATWRAATYQVLCYKERICRAEKLYRNILQQRCLLRWKTYHCLCQNKLVLNRLGEWFLERRLLAEYYSAWKLHLASVLEENRKTITALWHWNQKLKLKCFGSWSVYVVHKRRKRNRYSSALVEYRRRLLKIGVLTWMKTSQAICEDPPREEQCIELNKSEDDLVLKYYFMQWKKQALCQTGKMNPSKVIPKDISVSSSSRKEPKIPTFLNGDTRFLPSATSNGQNLSLNLSTLLESIEYHVSKHKEGMYQLVSNASMPQSELLETVMDAKQFLFNFYEMKAQLKLCKEDLDRIVSDSSSPLGAEFSRVMQKLQDLTLFVESQESIVEHKMRNLNATLKALKTNTDS